MSVPSRHTLPSVGRTSPEIVRSSVVLPAPLAPSTAVTCPPRPSARRRRGRGPGRSRVCSRQAQASAVPVRHRGFLALGLATQVGLEHALVAADVPRRAGAITRPKSSTQIRSQTDITRSMWCSTSITEQFGLSSRSAGELAHVVGAEAAGRLVEQQQLRLGDERPRQRDSLLDRVGKRGPGGEARRPRTEPLERRDRPLAERPLVRSEPGRPSSALGSRVRRNRLAPTITFSSTVSSGNSPTPCSVRAIPMPASRWGLIARARSPFQLRSRPVRCDEAADHVEQRRLARAVWADHAEHLAAAHSTETFSRAVMPPNRTCTTEQRC
jgi:hypothetical protein